MSIVIRKLLPVAAAGVPDNRVPTIYRVDMKRPETFLAAQHFRMRDGDVIFISNSPTADLQRFVNILASSILPVATVRSVVP